MYNYLRKNHFDYFLGNFWNIGLLFIPTPGHTEAAAATSDARKCSKICALFHVFTNPLK